MTPSLPLRRMVDLTAFVAWIATLMILIMAVTASVGSVLSLWNRGSSLRPAD